MLIRTHVDVGALIRDRRKQLRLSQADLAARVAVSRQWIVGVERGNARAELGLVMRTLDELGVRLDTRLTETIKRSGRHPDIDAIVAAARKPL